MSKRANRLEAIKQIIISQEIGSQDELLQQLNSRGFAITQATLSRDLRQLKVAKTTNKNNKYAYILGENLTQSQNTPVTLGNMDNNVVSLNFSGNIAVIKTKPGHAGVLAYNIDNSDFTDILGTIAGDDTVIVILREGTVITKIRERILPIISNTN